MAVEKFPAEPGMIMLFARALGDLNPVYYDEEYARASSRTRTAGSVRSGSADGMMRNGWH